MSVCLATMSNFDGIGLNIDQIQSDIVLVLILEHK